MKVKELIALLSKLDPERNIWVGYDFPYSFSEPDFIPLSKERFSECKYGSLDHRFGKLNEGDYIHYAE